MKRLFVFLFGFVFLGSAFAAGENVPTSKSYVDAEIVTKQDKIAATGGAAQVLTNTGNAGEYGTKNIYDSSASYGGQSDALIDAQTMNTAIQNAIDSEFKCVDNDCTLLEIRGETDHQTKNLLDPSFMDNSSYGIVNINEASVQNAKILPTEPNKTYTLSADLIYSGSYYYYIRYILPDGTTGIPSGGQYMWNCGGSCTAGTRYKTFTFTTEPNATYVVFFANASSLEKLTLTNYQMEEGSTATTYEPYGNVYIPTGQQ